MKISLRILIGFIIFFSEPGYPGFDLSKDIELPCNLLTDKESPDPEQIGCYKEYRIGNGILPDSEF